MDEVFRRGNLSTTPFAGVLARIWREGLAGTLSVGGIGGPKSFGFEGGSLVIDRTAFPEKDFLKSLLTSGTMDLISLARAEEHAQKNRVSVIRAIVEMPLLEPGRLWTLLEGFIKEEVYPLFDLEEGEFEFSPLPATRGPALVSLFLPNLILEGVRRMTNDGIIVRYLPPEGETVQSLSPSFLDPLELAPQERYFLRILDSARTLTELCEASDLGKRESLRILSVFLYLGIAGTRPSKPKTGKLPVEMSLADMDKLLGIFNAKCSYIFKYMSKEIGPVALSVIGNSLEDIRSRLDPAFQGLELKADGRVELKSFLKTNMNVVGDENKRGVLRSMDEILVAEVLAVKRTLGSAHESALVKSLERIGELP
jgi:hypothetical protein